MFTGIVEALGKVEEIKRVGENIDLRISSKISHTLEVNQSLNHDGVCLTITKFDNKQHWVTAVKETLDKSSLKHFREGQEVNLERAMPSSGRFDGHIVQGHVDAVGKVEDIKEVEGSWLFSFSFNYSNALIVEKGSICINGVSLTCFDVTDSSFKVAIIPHTYQKTNFNKFSKGTPVNLEFDIIGKYISRLIKK
ncbi:MAG: riboflavin synthase [Cyclobacteriaceae bacterium]